MLAERGHAFEISEVEFSPDAGGKVREAGISLRIAPADDVNVATPVRYATPAIGSITRLVPAPGSLMAMLDFYMRSIAA